jgi:hypothetical protein
VSTSRKLIKRYWVRGTPGGQTSKLIAIIDDNEAMLDSLRDLIESGGFEAECFGSATVWRRLIALCDCAQKPSRFFIKSFEIVFPHFNTASST